MKTLLSQLAALRRSLASCSAREDATQVVLSFLADHVGPTSVIDGREPSPPAGGVVAPLPGPEEKWVVVAPVAEPELVDLALWDLEATLVRTDLAQKEDLLKKTTEVLFKDAREVVRVLTELERRDEAVKAELHRALRFQRAMLGGLPNDASFFADALYLAADVISADFYDVAKLGTDHIRLFLADATGHGIAAGLATMFIKAEYEAQKRTRGTPAELVTAMNDMFTSRYAMLDLRCTALCIDLHPSTGLMHFTTAAHPGPIVSRADGCEALPSGGSFIGLVPGVEYTTATTRIERGDAILAFSDGLVDALDRNGASFGTNRVSEILRATRAAPAQSCSSLVNALAEFVGQGRGLTDDVTALVLALPAAPTPR